jgi:hypothetical protein
MEPRTSGRLRAFACIAGLTATLAPAVSNAVPLTSPQDRLVDPVILTGSQFPVWSAGPDPTVREPGAPGEVQPALPEPLRSQCRKPGQNQWDPQDDGDHSCTHPSRLPRNPLTGAATNKLLGYRWNGSGFEQIPLQVDERFTRYLSNNASGFAFYSWTDKHNTYAFDREGFRFSDNAADDVCRPIPRKDPVTGERIVAEADPVIGLDDDDEIVFMARDAGAEAPIDAQLPQGIVGASKVAVTDPSNPGVPLYAYVMLAGDQGPTPEFTAENSPYVQYQRDTGPNRLGADLFVYSQSSYGDYGAAPRGAHCDPATGEPVRDGSGNLVIRQRRPLDTAWVTTPRYAFRYDGRWLMTQLRVAQGEQDVDGFLGLEAADIPAAYGPDLIDRWKARAFQQDPSSETPCCGYEEEDTNWGGSSILFGERVGPVRVIRESWGADSSTNNVRREIFYRDVFSWGDHLRVHPIPPLDGIYSQWDYNAGRVTTYRNPTVPGGVAIDGQNDEVFGNLDDPCNPRYDGRGAELDERYRQAYKQAGLCETSPYHQSVDVSDPTISGVQALQWEQVSGPFGSMVLRTIIKEPTPGGTAQSLLAVPYYRDDSCFDDGTGTDPGPRRRERSREETLTYRLPNSTEDIDRRCWTPEDGVPDENFVAGPDARGLGDEVGDERFFQGSIGTSGTHILLVAESDNAAQTVPLTEIVTEQRIVVLRGDPGNVGEAYSRTVEKPLLTLVTPIPVLA